VKPSGVPVRVGLDFDNTMVGYDSLFHKVAAEAGWIPADFPVSKVRVRDHLRSIDKEAVWTEMQGYVYGARMAEAEAYPGLKEFLLWARSANVSVSIISHKTRHPFLGPKYDLHEASRDWIARSLRADGVPLVQPEDVFFELTKEEKMRRIGAAGCELYVDDLPEILLAPEFPASTDRLLFDPEGHHRNADLPRAADWGEVRLAVEKRWRPNR
jgi:hypothetical protein